MNDDFDPFSEIFDLISSENGIKALLYIGIATVINWCWQALEMLFYGAIRPDAVDTIMGLAFAFVAYKLLRKSWKINGG